MFRGNHTSRTSRCSVASTSPASFRQVSLVGRREVTADGEACAIAISELVKKNRTTARTIRFGPRLLKCILFLYLANANVGRPRPTAALCFAKNSYKPMALGPDAE